MRELCNESKEIDESSKKLVNVMKKFGTGEGRRKWIPQAVALILSLLLFAGLYVYAHEGRSTYDRDGIGIAYETVRVLEILEDNTEIDPDTENVRRGSQVLRVEILTGRYAGDVQEVTNYLSAMYNVYPDVGDTISVSINTIQEGVYSLSVYNYSRDGWIWGFVGFFALVLVLVGRKKGLQALVSLAVTVCFVLFLLVPLLVQRGWPTIPTTLGICAFTIFVSFVILDGITVKSMVAVAGSVGGVALAGLFAWAAGSIVHISGMNMDEAESLLLTAVDHGLKVRGLFICGVLIAAEGAVMDIAMSISSAVSELHDVNPGLTARELFRSGMNIGRDAMGTMANTLVLAFAGASLNMMIFIYAYDVSYIQLMNTDFVAIEVIRGLAGSLGIILTVPLVAAVSSFLLGAKRQTEIGAQRPAAVQQAQKGKSAAARKKQ